MSGIEQPPSGEGRKKPLPTRTIGEGEDYLKSLRERTALKNEVLAAWANERGVLHLDERNARMLIASAIKEDINDMERGRRTALPEINKQIFTAIGKWMDDPIDEGGILKRQLVVNKKDSASKEPQLIKITELIDQTGEITWIAEEVSIRQNRVISQSIICPEEGTSLLTLDYRPPYYKGENPNIQKNPDMPRGASTVFELLATAAVDAKRKHKQ